MYPPDAPEYAETKEKLLSEIEPIMKALGKDMGALPLLWAADFIPIDNHSTKYVVGEFNCSCLGLAGYLNARGKDIESLSQEDKDMGQGMANKIAEAALAALTG